MFLTDLDLVLEQAGLTVDVGPGDWRTWHRGPLEDVRTVIIHHTAGAAAGDYPSYGVVRNGRPKTATADALPGPLAQLGVGRSGKVYLFSAGKANHAGTVRSTSYSNAYAVGIEVESVGTGPVWPEVQVHAAARTAAALCRRYGLPASAVLGHKEVCSPPGRKPDPVGIPGDMPAFRHLVQHYLDNPNGDDMNTDQDRKLDELWRTVVTGNGYDQTALAANLGYIVEQIRIVASAVTGGKVDADKLAAQLSVVAAKAAGDAVRLQVLPALADVLESALGADNTAMADEILRRLADKIGAAAPLT